MCKYTVCLSSSVRIQCRELHVSKEPILGLYMQCLLCMRRDMWYMKKGTGWADLNRPHFLFAESRLAGPEAMMCLLRSNVHSKSPHVKEWAFCTSVQSCPLQHPAGVAMVTSCNLALTHRSRHTLLVSGADAFAKCIDCPLPSLVRGYVQSQRYAGTSPFGSEFPGEVGMNLSRGSGPKQGTKGEESKFMEVKCGCFWT